MGVGLKLNHNLRDIRCKLPPFTNVLRRKKDNLESVNQFSFAGPLVQSWIPEGSLTGFWWVRF